MALLTGLTLSLSTVSFEYIITTGFNLDQSNHDSNLILGILFLPFFLVFKDRFSWFDILESTISIVIITVGVIAFARSIQIGFAGPT